MSKAEFQEKVAELNKKEKEERRKKIHRVNYKVIKSGNVVELIHYSEGYLKGFSKTKSSGSKNRDHQKEGEEKENKEILEKEKESEESIRTRSSKRAAKKLIRIINANANQYGKNLTSKFLTLTFGEDVKDLEVANKEFTGFVRRLNYSIYKERKNRLKYTAVWELTEKGRIHYHVIFYNMPFIKIDKIVKIWKNGIAYINAIDKVDNIGLYIAKYMSKPDERYLQEKFKDKKRYFSSTGLKEFIEITDPDLVMQAIIEIFARDENPKYEYEFDSENLGLITYKSYIIEDFNLLQKIYGIEDFNSHQEIYGFEK